jgi:Kef-type K+ transport system membrane component KefB
MHNEILTLALVLAAALVGGRLATKLGYPSILGEITAGILLGPPLLGLLTRNEAVDVLGEFGVLLMMLYIGMHLDLSDLRKVSKPGLLAAAGGFLVPAGLGVMLMLWVDRTMIEAIFVGLAMGVTSLLTKSRILVDLKILDTRIAHVLVAGALLSDVTVLVVFAAIVGPETAGGISVGTAVVTGVRALAFGLGAWLVGARLFPAVKRIAGQRELSRASAFLTVIVLGLFFAWAAELAGLHAILGAFVAGLFLDREVIDRKVSRDVQQKLSTVSVSVLAPFFFVSAGFEVSFQVFSTDPGLLVAVIVLASVGKILGTAVFYVPSGNGWREGVVVGTGMNGRGAVEIIVAELALAQGLIDREVFSILVFMALFTTATVPVLLTWGVGWLRRRGELVKAGDRDRAIIVGAGPIARVLGLAWQESTPVVLIDTNRANTLTGVEQGLNVVPGNGLDEVVLESSGIDRARALVAATPNAEVNMLIAQMAIESGVPEVTVMLRDSDAQVFSSLLDASGITVVRVPEAITDWEHAVTTGEALLETIDVPPSLEQSRDSSGPPVPDQPGFFPIAVLNSSGPQAFTRGADINSGDRILVLSRAGIVAFGETEDKVPRGAPTRR